MASSGNPSDLSTVVVLVDDDEAVLRATARLLGGQPYTVVPFVEGAQAVERVRQGGVGVVVSDISMPGMTGLQLLRAVREHDPDLPVVLTTGLPGIESASEAVEHGAFKYLSKPVDAATLRDAVGRALRLYRLAQMKREALSLLGPSPGAGDRAGREAMFKKALSSIWIAFQPIVLVENGSVYGYEALLRSHDAVLAGPGEIISAAERLGELMQLGRLVRRLAADPMDRAERGCSLFVNLHPEDLLDPELADPSSPLARIAHRVVLEITERASLTRLDDVARRIERLRKLGFRIAVDDMGAGYAGLTSFAMLEPEIVKLDMSLVRDIDTNVIKQKVVSSMIGLCKDLRMKIVAEGVETVAERDKLVTLGCDLLQGYLHARPGPAFPELTPGA